MVLGTSTHMTHVTQISCTRGVPIIYTRCQYTYICTSRPSRTIPDNSLSCSFRLGSNTELIVRPNHCACSLASVITKHLHRIVQILNEEEWTHLHRGDMRACSRRTVSKPTRHQRLHRTMQLPDEEKKRTSSLETCARYFDDTNRNPDHRT